MNKRIYPPFLRSPEAVQANDEWMMRALEGIRRMNTDEEYRKSIDARSCVSSKRPHVENDIEPFSSDED